MNAHVLQTINKLIETEGGYCNNKDDLGGATCWGVTEREARADGYYGDMRDYPKSFAKDFYYRKFWHKPNLPEVSALSEAIAEEVFDTGVNMGVGKAGEFLQIALNAFNKQATLYPDIEEDGDIGSGTLRVLATYLTQRKDEEGEAVMVAALNAQQGARYLDISRTRQANETFTFGWFRNRVLR
jgi:lysozyme family protein